MPEKTYVSKVMMVEKKQTKPRLGRGEKKQGFSISFTLKHSLWLKNNKEDF